MVLSQNIPGFLLDSSSLYRWIVALGAIGAVLLLKFLIGLIQRRLDAVRQVAGFPSPPGHWLRGHLDYVATRDGTSLQYYAKCAKEFKTAFCIWLGPLTSRLVLCHPETVKVVQSSHSPKAANQATNFLRPFLRDGLVISEGEKWFRMRRLLTPAFHFKILKEYFRVFHASTCILLPLLGCHVAILSTNGCSLELCIPFLKLTNKEQASISWKPGLCCVFGGKCNETYDWCGCQQDKWSKQETVEAELLRDISLMTLDSILKTAFSYHSNCQLQQNQDPYISAVLESAEQIITRQLNPLLHSDFIYKLTSQGKRFFRNCSLVYAKAYEVLNERRRAIQGHEEEEQKSRKKKNLDFLDILLEAKDEAGNGLNDEVIIDEIVTFMFAGHDTTSSAISWTLYCLACFPEHQMKCQQEVDDVFGDRDELNWEDLGSLAFIHMCIKESMRIYTTVPIIGRALDKPYEIDGRLVAKGTWIMTNVYALHHNPHVWQEPEKFDPFRFTTENSKQRSPYAYIPFAAGPRNCIGQNFAIAEIKVTVAMILRKYNLSVEPKDIVSMKDLQPLLILRAKNGLKIQITSRDRVL